MERLARKEGSEVAKKRVPLGRYGTVKEIADATIYLFSDAGNYVSGQTLVGEFDFPTFPRSLPLPHLPLSLLSSPPRLPLIHNPRLPPKPPVDGAAWRTAASNPGSGFQYPDFLLNDEVVTGVKGVKKEKAKAKL